MNDPIPNHIQALAEKLWRYHKLNQQLTHADVILVLCSHDEVVAERGAELLLQGWAPLLVFSGGFGAITRSLMSEPEADIFARIAISKGVPAEQILIENRSSNTGENILFTKQLLSERGLFPQRFILVQKPYMERRSYATFKKLWPEKDVIVTSPQVSFADYLSRYANAHLTKQEVISIMVGDLQRIKLYPAKGFQIPQEIPADVWEAFAQLVAAGYDKRLVEEH